jgi:hypothetical protein
VEVMNNIAGNFHSLVATMYSAEKKLMWLLQPLILHLQSIVATVFCETRISSHSGLFLQPDM